MEKYNIFCFKNDLFYSMYVYIPPEDTKLTKHNKRQGGVMFIYNTV